MKERPILFSAPMVRAILDGRKTQTRRVVKPHPTWDGNWFQWNGHKPNTNHGACAGNSLKATFWMLDSCPYGQPGDRLWVRETFQYRGASYDGDGLEDAEWFRCYGQGGAPDSWDPHFPDGWSPSRHMKAKKLTKPDEQEGDGVTGWGTKRIPSIHMPRWASRITLEITGVRVERLQDISEADAIAEGAKQTDGQWWTHDPSDPITGNDPVESYSRLWEYINGPGSWEANPWVWVIEFKNLKDAA